jgi:hypothetical protein
MLIRPRSEGFDEVFGFPEAQFGLVSHKLDRYDLLSAFY